MKKSKVAGLNVEGNFRIAGAVEDVQGLKVLIRIAGAIGLKGAGTSTFDFQTLDKFIDVRYQ